MNGLALRTRELRCGYLSRGLSSLCGLERNLRRLHPYDRHGGREEAVRQMLALVLELHFVRGLVACQNRELTGPSSALVAARIELFFIP
jgi:hypothetical protein